MKVFITVISVVLTAMVLAGCTKVTTTETAENSNTVALTNSTNSDGNTTTNPEWAFTVEYRSEPGQIQAGQRAMLYFTVKDRQGAIVKDLQIVHEKPMHVLIVSRDLAEFYHVHPEQQADGSYRVLHNFPNGGEYKLYADFTPKEAVQVIEQVDIRVEGVERTRVPLRASAKFDQIVDSLRVVMKPDGEIRSGKELMINFQVFDAASGKPATDLQNYLGELAHFVIISEDMKDFVHAHPMSKGEPMGEMKMDGDDHGGDGHKHSTMEGVTTKPSASEVAAHTTFPRPGLYKVWAQFQRNNKIITVPFVVNVAGDMAFAAGMDTPKGRVSVN